jgi:hypothetical protein
MLELALKKQRLQLRSAAQREALASAAVGIAPLFAAVDAMRNGVRWLRRHPEWLVGGLVALVVARPRTVARWAQRAFFAWQAWRRVSRWRAERLAR